MQLGALIQDLQSGYSGFGHDPSMSPSIATHLRKALDAGYATSNLIGGAALRPQSLEGSVKVQTWTQRHLVMTKLLQRTPAFSTVEEWTEAVNWGTPTGGFVLENDQPASSTASYVRKMLFMKYAATVRGLSHVMATIHPAFGDNIALENRAGVLWLLERVERAVYEGDSTLAPSGQGVEFDGLANLIDPSTMIDLADKPISQPVIEDLGSLLLTNKAYPDSLVLGVNARRDLIKGYFPFGRVQQPMPAEGKLGMHIKQVDTSAGDIDLFPSIFLEESKSPEAAATHANAPTAPASVTTAVAGTDGDFAKAAPAGDDNYYRYYVTYGNRFGESAPTLAAAAIQVTQANKDAGVHVTLTVTNSASPGTYPAEWMKVYRTKVSAAAPSTALSKYAELFRAPVTTQAPSAANTVDDLNLYLPFTSKAFMGQWDEEIITMRELLPMFRLDMGVQALAYRWIVAWYCALGLFASRKWGTLLNVGRLS